MALRAYLVLAHAIPLAAPAMLRRRLRAGREDPSRWREKLGEAGAARPAGRLVWLHAVGLGEVLALRGLIAAMAEAAPDLSFLVTSSARSSAEVMAGNLPTRTVHQYLPLDAPRYLDRFLNHWQPGLSVWAEQDLWPGAVWAADRRGIPLALVNARMNAAAAAKRARAAGLYRDAFARFRMVAAQDTDTARHLTALGARDVAVTGSVKAAAPPLAVDADALADLRKVTAERKPWLASSTHPEDEAAALAVQAALYASDPARLLIIVPRTPARLPDILSAVSAHGLTASVASQGAALPVEGHPVHIDDRFGMLGLWYRAVPVALIGGSFGATEGHNPWEAAALGCAVLHGPRTANFAGDYARLHAGDAARLVTQETLTATISNPALPAMAARARTLWEAQRGTLAPLARDLIALMERE
jgi:3-deoxy-D-manno-octulosonic-acid transferase